MRILLPIAGLLVANPLIASEKPAKPICQDSKLRPVAGVPKAGAHPLGQEPPAKGVRTVLRTVDGCSSPVLVSDRDHGTNPAPPRRGS